MKQFDVARIIKSPACYPNPSETCVVLTISGNTEIASYSKKKLESYFRKSYRKFFGKKK